MLARADIQALPVASNSIDLIFCDPPYLREYLPCYGWLAREAMRVLKPGGFVLAMAGGAHLNQVFQQMDSAGLDFYWDYQLEETGGSCGVYWHKGNMKTPVIVRHKHILGYVKGNGLPNRGTTSLIRSDGKDKRYHHWGQNVSSARYCVEAFSAPGDMVLDPFVGGGTTAVACELIGRRCIGFDLDPAALATTATRLSQSDIHHNLPLFSQVTP